MCGIVGYVGPDQALPIILEGLRRLEYRGYDSAGVAVVDGDLSVVKRAGKVDELEAALETTAPSGSIGMGHTRWATHGIPSNRNAHPHLDCAGRIAVIHNGIIENFMSLRTRLEEEGQLVELRADSVTITDLDGIPVSAEPITVDWDVSRAQKSGYDDFMLKEIHE